VRLSSDTDSSTSVERQQEQITLTAQARGDTIVAITTDTDVSGTTSPFLRPSLGPWLREPGKIAEWQCLAFTKIDRVSRNLLDFVSLLRWCDEHGKTLLSIGEGVDFGTPVGRLIGQILAMFAEFEVGRMSERREDASRKLYSRGGFNGGGSLPWGYRAERINGQIELRVDTELAGMINEIADAVIGGASVVDQAFQHDLDPASLLRRLKKVSLKGIVTYHGVVIRGDDGLPLLRTPVVTPGKFARLQARLSANAPGRSTPRTSYPWLHVLTCDKCGEDLYLQKIKNTDRSYLYHKKSLLKYKLTGNPRPCTISLSGRVVHAKLEPCLLDRLGGNHIPEILDVAAEDSSDDLAEVTGAIAQLEADRYVHGLFRGDAGTARYITMMTNLEAQAETLRAMPVVPAGREVTLSADTFRERWTSLSDDHERGDLLRRMGVRVFVSKDDGGNIGLRVGFDARAWLSGEEWPGAYRVGG
jgi:DNA invertase Pin-like site-specific DNA recombinase